MGADRPRPGVLADGRRRRGPRCMGPAAPADSARRRGRRSSAGSRRSRSPSRSGTGRVPAARASDHARPGGVHGADADGGRGMLVGEPSRALRAGEADVLWLPSLASGRHSTPRPHRPLGFSAEPLPTPDRPLDAPPAGLVRRVRALALEEDPREPARLLATGFVRDHGDELSLRVYREPGRDRRLFRVVEEVAAKTYQRGLGVAPRGHRGAPAHYDARPRARLVPRLVLSVGDRPARSGRATGFGGTFFVGHAGLRPGVRRVPHRDIPPAARDRGPMRATMTIRDARLRARRVGVQAALRERVLGGGGRPDFRPRFRGVRVNATRTALEGTVALGRGVAARTGLAGREAQAPKWRAAPRGRRATSPVG